MQGLIAIALILSGIMFGMSIYMRSRPPEASLAGILWLRRGLWLGTITSAAVLVLYIFMLYFPPVSPSLFWPLTVIAVAGNVATFVSLVWCLRERNGESLFAALLILLTQFLWILYAIRVLTVDF